MFAVGGGITLFIISAITQSYTCSTIALTLILFLYAGSVAGHGSVFKTKRFGSRLLYICGIGVLILISLLICTKFGHSVFGYGVPTVSSATVAVSLSLSYFVLAQVARYLMSPKGKNIFADKKQNEEEIEENQESEDTSTHKASIEDFFEEETE